MSIISFVLGLASPLAGLGAWVIKRHYQRIDARSLAAHASPVGLLDEQPAQPQPVLLEADTDVRPASPPKTPATHPKTEIAPLPSGYERWKGARPEPRGAPDNTILAVPGIQRMTPAFRAGLLQIADDLSIPVDSLASIIGSESGFKPDALNPLPAAGLIQLTVGANLPGFTSKEAIRAVARMSAEEQLPIIRAYYERIADKARAAHPGRIYMLNFLPEHANRPEDYVLGSNGAPGFSGKVYDLNIGLDPKRKDGTRKGHINVGDVYNAAARSAGRAKGQRITIDGAILSTDPVISGEAAALRRGSKGPHVAKWQRSIETLMPGILDPHGADGDFGPRTEEATRLFQREKGLPDSGVVDTKTQSAMDAALRQPQHAAPRAKTPTPSSTSASGIMRALVEAGKHEPISWKTIRVNGLDISVSSDALMGSHGDHGSLRFPVSWEDVIIICRLLECAPLTQTISDAIYNSAPEKLTPIPLSHGPEMLTVGHVIAHGNNIDAATKDRTALIADVGKDWIVHPAMLKRGACNYGWRRPGGRPIQGIGDWHNAKHFDYSQACRLVKRWATDATGARVDLLDIHTREYPKLKAQIDKFR